MQMVMIMKCEYCKGKTASKRVRKHHWLNGRLYIVENVEAEVCQQCGERYYHATTLDRIDKKISRKHKVKDTLSVEVITA